MKQDIFKGHVFLLILMALTIGAEFVTPYLPEQLYEVTYQYIVLAVPAIIYLFIRKKKVQLALRLHPLGRMDITILIILAFVMQPAIYLLGTVTSHIFGNPLQMVSSHYQGGSITFLVLIAAIGPAICEELVFRGVLLNAYKGQSMYTMIIMNGLLFGLFHLNMNQFVYTFYLGVLLALSVYYTNSIFAGMLLHFMNNFLGILIMISPGTPYARFINWAFKTETFLDGFKMLAFGIISFFISFQLVNLLGRRNRSRYLHEAASISDENVLNGPLIMIGLVFLVSSIFLILHLA